MAIERTFAASGHENVTATHESTLEVTTDDWLTPAGDCIVAVDAPVAPADLDSGVRSACQDAAATISLTIEAGEATATVTGRGDPDLTLTDDRSFVCRTSDYVDDRTLCCDADAAAADLPRSLVDALADGADATVTLRVA